MKDSDNFANVMQCAYSLFDIDFSDLFYDKTNEKEDNKVVFTFPHDKEKVIIPSNVTQIDELYECSVYSISKKISLTRFIEVDENNKLYSSYNGCLYNKDKTKLIYCPDCIEKVVIPSSVTSLESGVLGCCSCTTHIEVEKDNKQYSSYNGCLYDKDKTKLIYCPVCKKTVVLPYSVENIDINVFGICNNIKSIEVEEDNKNYSSYEGCLYNKDKSVLILVPSSIKVLKLSDTLKSINQTAFDFCNCLESIEISCVNEVFTVIDRVLYSKNLDKIIKVPLCYKGTLVISDRVMAFDNNAFKYKARKVHDISIEIDDNNKYLTLLDGELCKKNN